MDNDQRDRRDWPEPDSTPREPVWGEASDEARSEPGGGSTSGDWTPTDAGASTSSDLGQGVAPSSGEPSASEIESWPSQETSSWGSTDPSSGPEPSPPDPAWPTEPPTAGTGSADAWPPSSERGADPWPTSAMERSEPAQTASAWETSPDDASAAGSPPAAEPPPSEVEAYPAASVPDADVPAAAVAAGSASAHAVPETQAATGESTQCPRCGTENRPGLAFCRNCGQRLVAAGVPTTVERPSAPEGTMACPRCGTHNRAGVAFCQNCGANLRGAAPGYVPPAVATAAEPEPVERERRRAILGPVVLLIGVVGLITGYLLPFPYGEGSLFERAFGADGYGATFWAAYPEVEANVADQAYFGLAAPVPLFAGLLAVLAVAGFARARPRILQTVGLAIALLWSVGLIVLFVAVELLGNMGGDLLTLLRGLSPAGIILFLASLIVLIGTLTRFGRS